MKDTNVRLPSAVAPEALLESLAERLDGMTPELRKAAAYVLDHPNDIGVSSVREIAAAAEVKPGSVMRMARAIGFEGYDDFREPFREEIRRGSTPFPDRARWLQSLARGGKLDGLYADMAAAAIGNIERIFADADANHIKAAADAIVGARHAYVLGDGMNHALARNFSYLAGMAMDRIEAIPREGRLAIDHLVRAGDGDVLLAMTFKPYRRDVVEAVEIARRQGVLIIGISDSLASPIVRGSAHGFVVRTDTPQFFPSIAGTAAFLETLMAFVIADAEPEVIASIERFHQRRQALGIYQGPERPVPNA